MAEPVLELDKVTVRRGMGVVLHNFSLTVNGGDCVVLYGETVSYTHLTLPTKA